MNDPRQIWNVDYYAEILDLREENRELKEQLDNIKGYLDECISYWRNVRNNPDHKDYVYSFSYIDAFQSMRLSIFGETLE
jgi:hypothetical protein